uniref:Uncharacterized protein n=1 Tax=Mycena chlorophos TaxID=658473 RepID=A0ABQ0L0F0_MYCCL|nr:predicted protein [Mycena chlorophos]
MVKQRVGPVWEYAWPKAKKLVPSAKNGVARHSITKALLTFMLVLACMALTTSVASYYGHAWARGYFRDPPPGPEQMGRGVILLLLVVVVLALGAGWLYLRGMEEREPGSEYGRCRPSID